MNEQKKKMRLGNLTIFEIFEQSHGNFFYFYCCAVSAPVKSAYKNTASSQVNIDIILL